MLGYAVSNYVVPFRRRNHPPAPWGNQSPWRGNPLRVSPFQHSPRKSCGSLPPFLARSKSLAPRPRGHAPLDSPTSGSPGQSSWSRSSRRFPPVETTGPPSAMAAKGQSRRLLAITSSWKMLPMLGDGFYGGRIFLKGARRPEAVQFSEKNLDLFTFIIEMRPDP
jgi:hypothetical protein